MREAVGGSMLFYFVLIFLFIYIVFIGLIMNYAATYRASNYVVTALEETDGKVSRDILLDGLKDRNYHNSLSITCRETDKGDAVYKVKTVVSFELPLIGVDLDLAINNETKSIYRVGCNIDVVDGGS